jgi:hypothetical protein
MFQVLGTIFFSFATLAAIGVIAAMLMDNAADIRRALGLSPVSIIPTYRIGRRRPTRVGGATPRARTGSPLRAAA